MKTGLSSFVNSKQGNDQQGFRFRNSFGSLLAGTGVAQLRARVPRAEVATKNCPRPTSEAAPRHQGISGLALLIALSK
jgi:hypothetical protein